MKRHAKVAHKSTVEQCFPSSAAHVALGAAAAIEDSASTDVDGAVPEADEIRRAVVRFVEFNEVAIADMPLPMGPSGRQYGDLEFKLSEKQWPAIAATLVPRLIDNLLRSWGRARDEVKIGYGVEVASLIEHMVTSGHADPRQLDKHPQQVLASWFEFSPRLAHLFSEHSPPRVRSAAQELMQSYEAAKLAPKGWKDMPQRLSLFAHQHAQMGHMMSP
jgi:hypothetical protein